MLLEQYKGGASYRGFGLILCSEYWSQISGKDSVQELAEYNDAYTYNISSQVEEHRGFHRDHPIHTLQYINLIIRAGKCVS